MSEADDEAWMRDQARARGLWFVKTVSPGNRGWPDRLLIAHGLVVFVEVKRFDGKGALSPHQHRVIRKLVDFNQQVAVIESRQDFLQLLDAAARLTP